MSWPDSRILVEANFTASAVPASITGVTDTKRAQSIKGIVTNNSLTESVQLTASAKISGSSWATVFLSGGETPIEPGESRWVQLDTVAIDYVEIHVTSLGLDASVRATLALQAAVVLK